MEEKFFKVKESELNAILSYLGTRPAKEVFALINLIYNIEGVSKFRADKIQQQLDAEQLPEVDAKEETAPGSEE